MRRWRFSAEPWNRVGRVDRRTRWIVGILIVLVIGLGIALIIVAGDNSDDGGGPATTGSETATHSQPTTTSAPTTTAAPTTTSNGGSGVPGGTTTGPNGEGGL